MMLYLLDYFELQSSLTAATTSMKIVNPQVFLVITLFNPIRYFFWHGTSGRNCRPSYLNPGTLSQDTFALKRITTDERTVSLLEQKIRRLERSIENVVQLHKAFSTDEQTFRGQVQTSLLQLENKIHQKNRTGEEKSVNFSLSLIRTIIRILFLPWTLPFSYLKGKFRFNGC